MQGNCFLITTYNRQESCQRLVDSLQGQGDIIVLGDAVDYIITGCSFYNLKYHGGKRLYYQLVKQLWSMRGSHDYYFMIPDDFLPVPGMVEKAISLWQSINDPKKVCLNLFTDRIGVRCWTKLLPEDKGDDIWQTGWVDMCFMSEDRFFRSFSLTHHQTGHSSGVGAQISRTLVRSKYSLFQVKESLVFPQLEHSTSQMHSTNNEINQTNGRNRQRPSTKRRSFDSRCLDRTSGR